MSTPSEENPNLDDVVERTGDALPTSTRTGHGKMPESIDDDDLQRATEQERVAAGLADYAPSDVPDATDPLPPEASDEADRAQRGWTEEESGE
ncbi:hypothetical protein D477_017754 [Arthrobacter crystallopoietes BAB-32]|uniref:Uncharacterized protein n=1 Tax=Arthrobacter crystallopoietes BAB-32 TaxID=1246476 RepID=N1V3S9_9MICC|nr:hypothetical protein [Arthrobacter crystallopoietes]EMY32893.1 hypothetical protein D477_017754 [Arthrobacter crystallopoietes BAB-32]